MLKLHILQTLNRVEGHGLSATTLRTELQLVTRVKCGELELRAALTELHNDGLVADSADDLTGDTLYSLTPAGTVRARA
jgi:DNA-binding PadR family transcriptional regulator